MDVNYYILLGKDESLVFILSPTFSFEAFFYVGFFPVNQLFQLDTFAVVLQHLSLMLKVVISQLDVVFAAHVKALVVPLFTH